MDTPPPAADPYHDLAADLLQGGIVMLNGDLAETRPDLPGRRRRAVATNCVEVSDLAEQPSELRTGGVQVPVGTRGSSGRCR